MWPASRSIKWAIGGLLFLFAWPVVQEFSIELARERGWYDQPGQRAEAIVSAVASLANNPLYPIGLAFVGGLFVGVWVDWLARKFDRAQEVRREKKSSEPRHFVNVTPLYLMGLYDGKTTLDGDKLAEPYLGKWLHVSGKVRNVASGKKLNDSRYIIASLETSENFKSVALFFENEWSDHLSTIPAGGDLAAHGRVTRIGAFDIMMEDCEITPNTSPI